MWRSAQLLRNVGHGIYGPSARADRHRAPPASCPQALRRLDRLLELRGLTLTELSERMGITLANLSILKTNKARAVRFSTLDALCRELRCQPGDLLGYRDDD